MEFSNKVAIVTGATCDIGAATATLLGSRGAVLTLVSKREDKLRRVAAECMQVSKQHLCIVTDLTQDGSCEHVVDETVKAFGKIDILINCASKIAVSSLFDQSLQVFDELMAINVRVPYKLTQLSLPHLLKTKGNVVNVASSMTRRWRSGLLPYLLSKSTLERFSKLAATEFCCNGVRINSINPGLSKEHLTLNSNKNDVSEDLKEKLLNNDISNDKTADPKEVAVLICLAASDTFPNMNGSTFNLDGAASFL